MKSIFLSGILALAAGASIAGDQPAALVPTTTDTGEVIYIASGQNPDGSMFIEAVADTGGSVAASSATSSDIGGILPVALAVDGAARDVLYAKLLQEAEKRGLR